MQAEEIKLDDRVTTAFKLGTGEGYNELHCENSMNKQHWRGHIGAVQKVTKEHDSKPLDK